MHRVCHGNLVVPGRGNAVHAFSRVASLGSDRAAGGKGAASGRDQRASGLSGAVRELNSCASVLGDGAARCGWRAAGWGGRYAWVESEWSGAERWCANVEVACSRVEWECSGSQVVIRQRQAGGSGVEFKVPEVEPRCQAFGGSMHQGARLQERREDEVQRG